MIMKFKNSVLIVEDMKQSIDFYKNILGLVVLKDLRGYCILSSGIILQSKETWKDMIRKKDDEIITYNHAFVQCYETEDIDLFMEILNDNNIPLIHPLKEWNYGQRIVRFYDPDGHVIEVGESLKKVVRRNLNRGLSLEEIAKSIGLSVDYIKETIEF